VITDILENFYNILVKKSTKGNLLRSRRLIWCYINHTLVHFKYVWGKTWI